MALDKISDILTQRNTVPSQVTKVKAPPLLAKQAFEDYKEEVEAEDKAHPGDNFSKYLELLNELKRNKTKAGLSDFVSTTVIEKTRQNKTVASIHVVLKEKYDLSKRMSFQKQNKLKQSLRI